MNASLTAHERETVINLSDGDDTVRIWTAQRKVITAPRKRAPRVAEVATGFEGGTEWAEFTCPADQWNVARSLKTQRAPLSEERRAEMAERLRAIRGHDA